MSLNDPRRAVLVDMAFELGEAGLAQFEHFLSAVRDGKWIAAALELQNSRLYHQVPKREDQNIDILMTGQWPKGITGAGPLVASHEGCLLIAKPDAKGKWVIGWGHDIPAPHSTSAPECTPDQANRWFAEDLERAEQAARRCLGPDWW